MSAEYYLPGLAHIHDAGFSCFGKTAARWVTRLLKEKGLASGRIIELGCGSGVVTRSLVRSGYEVSAVDSSPAMIRLAKRNCPRGRFLLGSLWEYDIPPCDAVIAVGECLNYEFEGTNTSTRLRGLFSRVHDAVRPGGLFVFDLLVRSQGARFAEGQKFARGKDWFVAVGRQETRTHIVREIVYFTKHGSAYRRGVEVHRQKKYRLPAIRSLLVKAGFGVAAYRGYGNEALGKNHAVLVAEKRK